MNVGRIVGIAAVWAVSLVGVGLWARGSGPGPQVTFQATGSIAGTVTDSHGGVIPGATLVAISESRGARSAPFISATSGGFLFPGLAPDVYTIEVRMPGFRVVRRPGITIKGGDHVTVPTLVMEVPQSQPRTVRPGDTVGAVISGADIGFQPMFSPNTPAGAVAGRWLVRVDGEWRVATGVVQTVPAR